MSELVARTRVLIRNATSSANDLNTTNGSPGHPNHVLTGRGKKTAPKESSHELVMLLQRDGEQDT